jgi:hypothetical protein
MMKSRRMRWVGHVTSMGGNRSVNNILMRKHERRKPLEDLHIHERTVLKWILKKMVGGSGLVSYGLG